MLTPSKTKRRPHLLTLSTQHYYWECGICGKRTAPIENFSRMDCDSNLIKRLIGHWKARRQMNDYRRKYRKANR